ncbi:hypothetical protein F5X99DRAFT_428955 [Biscogniauxia marginata]|nr:hypothetical protein F5X99DRAFT_428955 [Biscogniauxia marginata]
MFGLTRAATGLGRRSALGTPVVTLAPPHSRNTSWIAWEQPNPAIYAKPPMSARQTGSGSQKQAGNNGDKTSASGTRPAGETVVAPSTVTMLAGSQEVSTSGKTAPPSIQAGSSRTPFSGPSSQQTRAFRTQYDAGGHDYLPTTHLCIPGHAATWPCVQPEEPHQKRVRKLSRSAHEPSSGWGAILMRNASGIGAYHAWIAAWEQREAEIEAHRPLEQEHAEHDAKKVRWEEFKARLAEAGKGMSS